MRKGSAPMMAAPSTWHIHVVLLHFLCASAESVDQTFFLNSSGLDEPFHGRG
jgi:hypothetical protein